MVHDSIRRITARYVYARNVQAGKGGTLRDVKNLRYQAVFMMGTGGSGKTYVSHKWMKFMPGGGSAGYTDRKEWEQKVETHIPEQERGLSNLNFEAIQDRLEGLGFRVELVDASSVKIPYRLHYYLDGREIVVDPDNYEGLPDEVKASMGQASPDMKALKDVVFGTPKHELPTYWRQVNPDLYKEELAGYVEEQPGYVHEMSSEMSKAYFEGVLQSGDPLMVDGTGANLKKMNKWIAASKAAGYKTSVVYVYVPLTVAMIRNATRSRNVAVPAMLQQFAAISKNYAQLRGVADKAHFIDNRNTSKDVSLYEKNADKINAFISKTSNFDSLYDLIKKIAPKELQAYGAMLKGSGDDLSPRQREIERLREEKGITRRYASLADYYDATIRLAGFQPLPGELFWPEGSLS